VTDDVLFEAPYDAPEGLHEAIITAVEPVTLDLPEGPKRLIRWTAAVEFEDTQPDSRTFGKMVTAEPDALSSLVYNARSKAKRWAVALGVDPEKRELVARDLVGRPCMVMIVKKDKGGTGIGDILPVPKKGGKAA
jgi:hypothetical protein